MAFLIQFRHVASQSSLAASFPALEHQKSLNRSASKRTSASSHPSETAHCPYLVGRTQSPGSRAPRPRFVSGGMGLISLGGMGDLSLSGERGVTSLASLGVTVTLVTLLVTLVTAFLARYRAWRSAPEDFTDAAFTTSAICSAVQPALTMASRMSCDIMRTPMPCQTRLDAAHDEEFQ